MYKSLEEELQSLLVRLAQFFTANESQISAAAVSNCFHQLPDSEITKLKRLFVIMYHSQPIKPTMKFGREAEEPTPQLPARRQWSADTAMHQQPSKTWEQSPSTQGQASSSPASSCAPHEYRAGATLSTDSVSPDASILEQANPTQTPLSDGTTTTAAPITPSFDPEKNPNVQLTALRKLNFTTYMKGLLRDCILSPGNFFRSIEAAKIALPNGQGWEAAIATKKNNADARDMLRIYHRFECYNIYFHVVEAGLHTGKHWIRDGRSELVKRLRQKFPRHFLDQRATNKCLNWVDQGCKYNQWTEMFGPVPDLGYLIALPSDVPHSAYTSRCTKEQMALASAQLKEIGITQLVEDLKLSNLGRFIAATLKDLTTKKRSYIDDASLSSPRKSLCLASSDRWSTALSTDGICTTSPEPVASVSDVDIVSFGNHDDALVQNLMQDWTPLVAGNTTSSLEHDFLHSNENSKIGTSQAL
ncbi:hypothetical protein LEL_10799 [Akanthomyces lecanii RCEF 1005]|uniref:Uncharacterized protein n=1 Tax=Akanthomyces lecanii RCEF 1005 TaxID=1081108 RepID=A0A167TI04_CORDF|nr:hypothetical protein LEL_10799 [Akanthomyces lecanii RCEF 1005]